MTDRVIQSTTCKRCGKEFYPLEAWREMCVECLKQQKADETYQRLAFGGEHK